MIIDFPEDTVIASQYVKNAIPLMMKHGITPNPHNFALWYVYVTDRDLELKRTLNRLLEDKDGFSRKVSRDLFRKHIVGDQPDLQQNLQASLTTIIHELTGGVENTQNGLNDYQRSLEKGLESISNEQTNSSLEETVNLLIKTTQSVKSTTIDFQGQLLKAENEVKKLRQQLEKAEQNSHIDPLTQLGNRRAFDKHIASFFLEAQNNTTLIIVDLDHFKELNDIYGHQMGDKVLQGVGKIMRKICPDNALAARYGGEEFALLSQDSLEAASNIAESIRTALSKLVLKKTNSGEVIRNITASFGVAQRIDGELPEQLIERADRALYAAKAGGRNQVKVASS